MPDPETPPGPEDQPVVAGADDVDRLLEQAQTLADQIASGTGTACVDPRPLPTPGTPPGEEKDALGATQEVEKALSELEGMLGTAAPATTGEPAQDDLSATPALSDSTHTADKPSARRSKNEILDLPPEADLTGNIEVDLGDVASESTSGDTAIDATASDAGSPSRSPRAILTGMRTTGLKAAWAVLKVGPAMLNAAAEAMDRPFVHLSQATKQYIGYVAIVTILAAIASFVMPPLFASNPYLKIDAPVEATAPETEAKAPAQETEAPAHEAKTHAGEAKAKTE